jgi:hypothetical protein
MKTTSRIFILSFLVLGACTVPLSQGGSNVSVTNDEAVVQCDFIGLVKDHAPLGGFNEESSRNDFRSQAASMGATHVVFQTSISGSVEGAKAYRCLEPVMNDSSYGQVNLPPPIRPQLPPSNPAPPIDSGYRRY